MNQESLLAGDGCWEEDSFSFRGFCYASHLCWRGLGCWGRERARNRTFLRCLVNHGQHFWYPGLRVSTEDPEEAPSGSRSTLLHSPDVERMTIERSSKFTCHCG